MRIFNETQDFNQWWLQLIKLTILGFLIYAAYNWFTLYRATGNVSAEDRTAQVMVIIVTLVSLGLICIFRLITTIDEIGVHYQFLPINLSKKTIRWDEIKKCYVRTYSPIKEYGGWGYRMSFGKGKALNVIGNKGVQLELQNGKKVLIGTQKEEDAQKAIERYFKVKDE